MFDGVNRMRSRSIVATLAAFLLVLIPLLAAGPATTQSTQPTQPSTAPARHRPVAAARPPEPSAPFSLLDAATEQETDSLALRGIEASLGVDRSIAVIQEDLPILISEIDARLDESNKLLASNPALQLLGEQEQDWVGIQQNLEEWHRAIQQRMTQMTQQRKQLDELKKKWEAEWPILDYYEQYGTAAGKPLRDAAGASIQSALSQIDRTAGDQRAVMLQNAQLEQTVSIQGARVADILFSIRQARDDAFNRLFERNAPPLWNVSLSSEQGIGLFTQGRDSLIRQAQGTIAYLKRRYENAVFHFVVFVLACAGLFRIRRVVGQWSAEDPALLPVREAFSSPVATGIVLSLLLSVWIYPRAPRMFWAVVGAAALIPTVVILRRWIDRRLFSILNALVVFYFLDQLRSIVAVVPVVARFLLMLEMLGGVVLLILFIRSTRSEATSSRLWSLVRFVGWLWTASFVGAFFCDVFGYVSLANLLGDASLGSAYLAVILYACARVLAAMLVIAVRTRPLAYLQMVRRHQPVLLARMRHVLYWLAGGGWVLGVLSLLAIVSPFWEITKKALSAELSLGGLHLVLGRVLAFAFTVWVSVRLSRFLRFVLEEDVYDRLALPSGIPYAVSKMVNYVVLAIGFFIAISASGVEMTQLTILASAFTLGIGFGLQNIFNNFVSGVILLFERPVRVGDIIQLDDTVGVVSHIGIRASVIRTPDSSEIIVPNGNLIAGKVVNWTLSNRQRGLTIPLTLASSAEPCKVIDLLTGVAAQQPLVTKTPAPAAFLSKLGGDSFSYELHVWTNNAEQWVRLRSELAVALNAELTKQGIAIK
jgi:small-conductance mechanosensitive channel